MRRAKEPPERTGEIVTRLLRIPEPYRTMIVRSLTTRQAREFDERWAAWAQAAQRPPASGWRVWLIRAGRGYGKTRAGAEWVSELARSTPELRIALVGATIDDARRVMIEGRSGLLAVAQTNEKLHWNGVAGELTYPNGTKCYVYSAERPDSLRGPEHHAAWCDELAKWRYGEAAWDNLMLTLRLGDNPRTIVTTTPKPTNLMRKMMALTGFIETRGGTTENPHLPDSYVAAMLDTYGGTRLGRQELDGELIDDVPGALWHRAMLEATRVAVAPALVRVVVAVDPPASAEGDACGIVAVGLGADGHGYVIADATVAGLSPDGWARAVVKCARAVEADRVIAEKNQGGDMVANTLRTVDATLPLRLVHASKGKGVRAEPVAALYEQGKAHHVGMFAELEDQLCGLGVAGDYAGPGRSPDRADALVWALTEVLLKPQPRAAVRKLTKG